MRKINFVLMAVVLLVITACKKESYKSQLQVQQKDTPKEVRISEPTVEHGMLVFENEESFRASAKKLDKMCSDERKAWEEKLGFKSYDRLCNEVMDAESDLGNKYENISPEEQKVLLINGNYEKHAKITYENLEKGNLKIVHNEDNSESVHFKLLMYPKLINVDGFIIVGERILQYTEEKFKAIRNIDFSKIENLKTINTNCSNDEYYVTDICSSLKSTSQPDWNCIAHNSNTIDNKKIVFFEFFSLYDPYDSGDIEAYYSINNRAEKYQWPMGWTYDKTAHVYLYGGCTVNKGYTSEDYNQDKEGAGSIEALVFNEYYPRIQPAWSIPTSYWTSARTGGSNGIYISVENHIIEYKY